MTFLKFANTLLLVVLLGGVVFWVSQRRTLAQLKALPLLKPNDPRASLNDQLRYVLSVTRPGDQTYKFRVRHESSEQIDVGVRVFGQPADGTAGGKARGFPRNACWCRFRFVDGHVLCLVSVPTWRDSKFVLYHVAHGSVGEYLCRSWDELEVAVSENVLHGEKDFQTTTNVLRVSLPAAMQKELSGHADERLRALAAAGEVFSLDLKLVPRRINDG